jgi:hypothetical protein
MANAFEHRRLIDCQTVERFDGRWQLEAILYDFKGAPFHAVKGTVMPGEALHHIQLTLVFDRDLKIHEAHTRLFNGPSHDCHHVDTSYSALVGLTLGPGFNRKVQECFGGPLGCTHMNELLPIAATVAMQTEMGKRAEAGLSAMAPYVALIENQCHTWRSDGPALQAVKKALQPI